MDTFIEWAITVLCLAIIAACVAILYYVWVKP